MHHRWYPRAVSKQLATGASPCEGVQPALAEWVTGQQQLQNLVLHQCAGNCPVARTIAHCSAPLQQSQHPALHSSRMSISHGLLWEEEILMLMLQTSQSTWRGS